ncbi:MAG: chromatin protein Cren7 [Desulfurococcales archaeon]|nr:chromatin protein Cren7 [Desulfurococcales archaeon]
MKCPRCGTEVQPQKTWQLVAPLPDADGRVTIIVMGSFKCPNCGYSWRQKISTIKVGPEGEVDLNATKKRKRKKKEKEKKPAGKIIEVDLSDIYEDEEL